MRPVWQNASNQKFIKRIDQINVGQNQSGNSRARLQETLSYMQSIAIMPACHDPEF